MRLANEEQLVIGDTIRQVDADEKMSEIYAAIAAMSPALLAVVPEVITYAGNITR